MGAVTSDEDQKALVTLLLKRKALSPPQAELALQIHKRKGEPVEDVLIRMGWVSETEISKLAGELWSLPVFTKEYLEELDPKLVSIVPEDLCCKYSVVPLYYKNGFAWVAMSDPFDLLAIDDLQRLIGQTVKPVLATKSQVSDARLFVYSAERESPGKGEEDEPAESAEQKKEKEQKIEEHKEKSAEYLARMEEARKRAEEAAKSLRGGDEKVETMSAAEAAREDEALKEKLLEEIADIKLDLADAPEKTQDEEDANMLRVQAGDPPVVKIVNYMLVRAIDDGASDIHVEPVEDGIDVRYRVDGSLFELISAPKRLKGSVLSRLKILSGMDIAVKRVPQDGSFSLALNQKKVDFRVNSLPTIYGEKIVLRLLEQDAVSNNKIGDLGLGKDLEEIFVKNIHRPHGMILVTGPTGSGKSTTLYTVLNEIKSPAKNVITVEDPAEYRLPGIQQVQVHSSIGFDFADALRAILRQDPDIIMIGEIRDSVTAQIAVKSSLTGHLVLSTLHTNDAPGAIIRLIDIGLDPFLVASSVTMAVAQRLVKRICLKCKEKYEATNEEKKIMGKDLSEEIFLYKGKGCSACRNTGYKGRLAVFEVFQMTSAIKQILLENTGMDQVREKSIEDGMVTLKECGFSRALEGLTTLREVLATCIEEK